MNLNIFVPGLESYMEDVSIVNNVNTEAPAEEEVVNEQPAPAAEEAPIAEEVKEETEEQKEEMFTSFWK